MHEECRNDSEQGGYKILEHLREARIRLGMTQEELGRCCGLSQSDLSRIERGTRELSLREAANMARWLRVPLEWFLSGKERPGGSLPEITAELRHLGLADLLVAQERVPGTYRP